MPTNPQNLICIETVCCTNKIYMTISDMDVCHRQWVTITQNLFCSTPSYPQTRTVHASRRGGFSEGNLVHIQMWVWEREGGEGEHVSSLRGGRREEGLKATLKDQGSVEVWVGGQGVVCLPSPNPSLLLLFSLPSSLPPSSFLLFLVWPTTFLTVLTLVSYHLPEDIRNLEWSFN